MTRARLSPRVRFVFGRIYPLAQRSKLFLRDITPSSFKAVAEKLETLPGCGNRQYGSCRH